MMPLFNTIRSILSTLQAVWEWLTRPSLRVASDNVRQSRVLSAMLLAIVPGTALPLLAISSIFASGSVAVSWFELRMLFLVGCLLAAYGINRAGYYTVAAAITIMVTGFGAWVGADDSVLGIHNLVYMVLPVLLAGWLFSLHIAGLIAAIATLAVLVYPIANPKTVLPDVVAGPLAFVIIVSALTLALTRHRILIEEDRTARLRERSEALLAMNTRLRAEVQIRERAEAALAEERRALAERVTAATADLRAANDELVRAARQKAEFLAVMSHELRTPLAAILGLADSLREEVYGPVNDRQERAVASISTSGEHLLALINDILDLSRIESRTMTLERHALAPALICRICLDLVQPDADRKQLQVHAALPAEPPMVFADERRLMQMLLNLLSNAVKFTPAGGEIGLELAFDQPGDCARFCVWDSGIGIPADQISRLFRPFVQLHTGLSRSFEGTGLGLVLVAQLAAMHGGEVGVTSEPGVGSRFWFTIPVSRGAEEVAIDVDDTGTAS